MPKKTFQDIGTQLNNVKECKMQPHNFSVEVLWSSRYLSYKFIYSVIDKQYFFRYLSVIQLNEDCCSGKNSREKGEILQTTTLDTHSYVSLSLTN